MSRKQPDPTDQPALFTPEELPPVLKVRVRSKRKDLEALHAAEANTGGNSPANRVYQVQSLVLCTLPYRAVKGVFSREAVVFQGPDRKVVLRTHVAPTLDGVPAPYGRDRLLLIWLITRAKQQGNRLIQFTRREFLEDFKGAFDPTDTNGFKNMAMRVLNMALTFVREDMKTNKNPRAHKRWSVRADEIKGYPLFSRRRVEYGDENVPAWRVERPGEETVYQAELSEEFWESEMARVVPLSMEVVRHFAARPKALDLVWFLSWRSYGLLQAAKKAIQARRAAGEIVSTDEEESIRQSFEARIPWGKNGPTLEMGPQFVAQDAGLRGMFGSQDSSSRRLKQTMEEVIDELCTEWWPEARIHFDGSSLVIRPPHEGRMLLPGGLPTLSKRPSLLAG